MPVLMTLTRILLPGNLERATATPVDTPMRRLIRVAVTDTFNDKKVMPITSGSNVKIRTKAFLIPSKMRSMENQVLHFIIIVRYFAGPANIRIPA